jgi:hypothetical protein
MRVRLEGTRLWSVAGLHVGDGITGRVAEDSLHSVGEPAPVGDPIVDAIGDSKCRVDVLHHLDGGVGSGDATQSSAIRKVSSPVGDPIFETTGERGGRWFSAQRPDLSLGAFR